MKMRSGPNRRENLQRLLDERLSPKEQDFLLKASFPELVGRLVEARPEEKLLVSVIYTLLHKGFDRGDGWPTIAVEDPSFRILTAEQYRDLVRNRGADHHLMSSTPPHLPRRPACGGNNPLKMRCRTIFLPPAIDPTIERLHKALRVVVQPYATETLREICARLYGTGGSAQVGRSRNSGCF